MFICVHLQFIAFYNTFPDIFDDKFMLELSKSIGIKHLQLGVALGFTIKSIHNMEYNCKRIEDLHLEIFCASVYFSTFIWFSVSETAVVIACKIYFESTLDKFLYLPDVFNSKTLRNANINNVIIFCT